MNRRAMDCFLPRLSEFASPDPHAEGGIYHVRSLYFDDLSKSAFRDKENGVDSRHKYRIRIYNLSDCVITLEKKIKEGSYIRKESAPLTRAEYDMIMSGRTDFLLKRSESAANDFAVEARTALLKPSVIVDYERQPFIFEPGNVRITFDMNIRSAFDDYDIFKKETPSYEVLGPDQLIMEVKYTQFLPDIFHAILPADAANTSASKYTMTVMKKGSIR